MCAHFAAFLRRLVVYISPPMHLGYNSIVLEDVMRSC